MKRLLKRLSIGLLIIGLLLVVALALFYNRFVIEAPEKEYPEPTSIEEAQLQDLNYLSLYVNKDRSFDNPEKKTAFFNYIDTLKSQVPLENYKFIMGVAKVMAQADNTHTNINPSAISRQVNAIPLRFYWFGNNLYIILVQSPYQDLLGVKINQINGKKPLSLLRDLKPWYGGSHNRLKFFSPLYFMSPELLDAIGHGHTKNTIELTYENHLGTEENIIIKASNQNKDDVGYWPSNWLNSTLMKSKRNWRQINNSISPAISFENTNLNVYHKFIENGLYVQLNKSIDSKTLHINDYLKDVLKKTKKKSLEFAILDLRFNPGGDYHIGRSFIKMINKQLNDNSFYIITGNGTFSAGIMIAAIAKNAANRNAVIIGESIGDRLQFWADGGSVMSLPNSKIPLRIWTAYHDWQNGCSDWSKCFWITIFDGVKVEHLNPDKRVSLKFSDYTNGEDSILNTILNMEK